MKIAVLAHLKFPIAQPFAGGLEMHTHLLAEGLIRRGHDVALFAAAGSTQGLGLIPIGEPTGQGHNDPVRQARVDAAEAKAYRQMMEKVVSGGFDIVHNNSLHPHPLTVAGGLDVPMVTALHTPPFDPLAPAMRLAGPGMRVVAVSDDLADHWSGLIDRIAVIPNGIDLAVFKPSRRRRSPQHAFWSGRIVPEKGLHLAIDAVRAAGLPLVFAGPQHDEDYWKTEIVPRLGPDLTHLGHLAHRELARRVAQASVAIVSPCWDEPFGLVVAEALACGTPVAAFARGAIASLVDATCGALARPDDATDLARAVRVAMTCDRRACRVHAEARFDSEMMVDRYEALYDRLVDPAKSAQTATPSIDPTPERGSAPGVGAA